MNKKLIVGLGNPGLEYQNTRHNIGFMVLDNFAENNKLTFKLDKKIKGEIATFKNDFNQIFLLKPQTFMNLSGESILKLIDYYKIELDEIIVIVDDINLEFGKLRLRHKGSSGGHNGLKNIIQNLKTENYKRVRIGLGQNEKQTLCDFVLSKFKPLELKKINEDIFFKTNLLINDFINDTDFEKIMSKFN